MPESEIHNLHERMDKQDNLLREIRDMLIGHLATEMMPISLGGPNSDSNMQLLRKRCNLQKQAKHPVDFMQSRGFLL